MGGKKRTDKTKVRVAHELPKRRRIAIKEALEAHQTEDRPEWDRAAEWGNIRLYRKIINKICVICSAFLNMSSK